MDRGPVEEPTRGAWPREGYGALPAGRRSRGPKGSESMLNFGCLRAWAAGGAASSRGPNHDLTTEAMPAMHEQAS